MNIASLFRYVSQHRNPNPPHQPLRFAAQEGIRRDDEKLVLHARRIVIGLDHFFRDERAAPTSFDSENGISPVDDRMPAPNTLISPCSSIRPNSIENQREPLQRQAPATGPASHKLLYLSASAARRNPDSSAAARAQAIVDHVRLRREFRVRAVANELRHRKASLGDVAVEECDRATALRRGPGACWSRAAPHRSGAAAAESRRR